MKVTSTPNKERIVTLDIIRGFALIGILFVNMSNFKSPTYQLQGVPSELASHPPGLLNQWSQMAIDLFAVGKFYPMFSFLFGLGFYIFYNRLQEKGLPANILYKRRIVFLLLIGFFHLGFIWSGDILFTYALAALILLVFIHRNPKTILRWASGLVVGTSIITGLLLLMGNFFIVAEQGGSIAEESQRTVTEAIEVYSNGSYLEILHFRLSEEIPLVLSNLFLTIPNVLGLFLIGFYVGKKGWIQHPVHFKAIWKKLLPITLIGGGLLSILFACLNNGLLPVSPWFSAAVAGGLNIVAGPLLMLFYITSAVLLCQRKSVARFFKPIAFVGQMALTNYLLQSVICLFIFYGFGLQLYGTIDASTGILITIVIYTAQIMLSSFWMGNFSQGPMEKMWRKWTYHKAGK